jgi:hypothetical protein
MLLIEVASDESLVQRKRMRSPEITVAAKAVRILELWNLETGGWCLLYILQESCCLQTNATA